MLKQFDNLTSFFLFQSHQSLIIFSLLHFSSPTNNAAYIHTITFRKQIENWQIKAKTNPKSNYKCKSFQRVSSLILQACTHHRQNILSTRCICTNRDDDQFPLVLLLLTVNYKIQTDQLCVEKRGAERQRREFISLRENWFQCRPNGAKFMYVCIYIESEILFCLKRTKVAYTYLYYWRNFHLIVVLFLSVY